MGSCKPFCPVYRISSVTVKGFERTSMGLGQDSGTFEDFEQGLRQVLAHLYDPAYKPPAYVWEVLGCDPYAEMSGLWAMIVDIIETKGPCNGIPEGARIRRLYDLLDLRYVKGLTQEATANRFCISPRHLRREQQRAVHFLARYLWEKSRRTDLSTGAPSPWEEQVPPQTAAQTATWQSQMLEELASLAKSAPGATAKVEEAVLAAVNLGSALPSANNTGVTAGIAAPDLYADVHPSVLHQLLIMTIEMLSEVMSSGQITVSTIRAGGCVRINVSGHPVEADTLAGIGMVREILKAHDGTAEVISRYDQLVVSIGLPAADSVWVLVADDNEDLVHVFRRYATGTRYQIEHCSEGQKVFQAISEHSPDVLVLDVMLADMDGWELLTQLRAHPDTRSIPIIVCSVIRGQELALALGAKLYLAKPVRRRHFIEALDQASAGLDQQIRQL